jgi:flagellar assembly factor FliW
MIINTKFLGDIEITSEQIIKFENGIPGFEDLTEFAVLDFIENNSIKCLQSIKEKDICLIMINPWDYFHDYEIELNDEEKQELDLKTHTDVIVYNILSVREDMITTNLVAPIIINVRNNKGKQIILSNTKYSIRQEILCL